MDSTNIQVLFFQHIRTLVPPHVAMVDVIADLLSISPDSVYRRIRGEKPVSLDEMQKLAGHFKISIDQFLHLQSDSFIFSGKLANGSNYLFEDWMKGVLQQLQFMNSFRNRHMYYLAKDLPVMAQFIAPELLAFKSFFWRKSILHYPELRGQKFSLKQIDHGHQEIGKKIIDEYNKLPSTEIWNVESINSTIRQIAFYKDAGAIESANDYDALCKAVYRILDHLERQAEHGVKFCLDEEPNTSAVSYNLFNNELILGDNTIVAELDNNKLTFLNHSVINFIGTTNEQFNNYMFGNLQNLIGKSTQLSKVGEKERVQFFNRIREKLNRGEVL